MENSAAIIDGTTNTQDTLSYNISILLFQALFKHLVSVNFLCLELFCKTVLYFLIIRTLALRFIEGIDINLMNWFCSDGMTVSCLIFMQSIGNLGLFWKIISPFLLAVTLIMFLIHIVVMLCRKPNLEQVDSKNIILACSAGVFNFVMKWYNFGGNFWHALLWYQFYMRKNDNSFVNLSPAFDKVSSYINTIFCIFGLLVQIFCAAVRIDSRNMSVPFEEHSAAESNWPDIVFDFVLIISLLLDSVHSFYFPAVLTLLFFCQVSLLISWFTRSQRSNHFFHHFDGGCAIWTLLTIIYSTVCYILQISPKTDGIQILILQMGFIFVLVLVAAIKVNKMQNMKRQHRIFDVYSLETPLKNLVYQYDNLSAFAKSLETNMIFGDKAEISHYDWNLRTYNDNHIKNCKTSDCLCSSFKNKKEKGLSMLEFHIKSLREALQVHFNNYTHPEGLSRLRIWQFYALIRAMNPSNSEVAMTIRASQLFNQNLTFLQQIKLRLSLLSRRLSKGKDPMKRRIQNIEPQTDFPMILRIQQQIATVRALMKQHVKQFTELSINLNKSEVRLAHLKVAVEELTKLEEEILTLTARQRDNPFIDQLQCIFSSFFRIYNSKDSQLLKLTRSKIEMSAGQLTTLDIDESQKEDYTLSAYEGGSGFVVRRTSCSVKGVMNWDAQKLVGETPNMLLPKEMRNLHSEAIKNYLATGSSRFLGHDFDLFILTQSGNIKPIRMESRVLFDHLKVQFLVATRIRRSANLNELILCDYAGNIKRVSPDLARLMQIEPDNKDRELPVQLFFARSVVHLSKIIMRYNSVRVNTPPISVYKSRSVSILDDELVVNSNMIKGMKANRDFPQKPPQTASNEVLLDYIQKLDKVFLREQLQSYDRYSVRIEIREMRLGPNSYIMIGFLDSARDIQTRSLKRQSSSVLYRLVLMRFAFICMSKRCSVLRKKSIMDLFTGQRLNQVSRKSNINWTPLEETIANGSIYEKADGRITSKFFKSHKFEHWSTVGFKSLILIFVVISCTALVLLSILLPQKMAKLANDFLGVSEVTIFAGGMGLLNMERLLPVIPPGNSLLTLKKFKAALEKLILTRVRVMFTSITPLAMGDTMQNQIYLPQSQYPYNQTYYSLISEYFNIAGLKLQPADKIQKLKRIVSICWNEFQARMTAKAFLTQMDDTTFLSIAVVSFLMIFAGIFLFITYIGFLMQNRHLNFVYRSAQFFDRYAFNTEKIEQLCNKLQIPYRVETSNRKSPLKGQHRQCVPRLIPIPFFRTYAFFLGIFLMIVFFGSSLAIYQVLSSVVQSKASRLYPLRMAHQQFEAALSIQTSLMIEDSPKFISGPISFNDAIATFINELKGVKGIESTGFVDLFDAYVSAPCKKPIFAMFLDCNTTLNGVLQTNLISIMSYIQMVVEIRPSMLSPEDRLSFLVFMVGIRLYLRSSADFASNSLTLLLAPVSSMIILTIVFICFMHALLLLLFWLFVINRSQRCLNRSLRLFNLLNPVEGFSNSHIRRFVEQLS